MGAIKSLGCIWWINMHQIDIHITGSTPHYIPVRPFFRNKSDFDAQLVKNVY